MDILLQYLDKLIAARYGSSMEFIKEMQNIEGLQLMPLIEMGL